MPNKISEQFWKLPKHDFYKYLSYLYCVEIACRKLGRNAQNINKRKKGGNTKKKTLKNFFFAVEKRKLPRRSIKKA